MAGGQDVGEQKTHGTVCMCGWMRAGMNAARDRNGKKDEKKPEKPKKILA